MEGIVAPQAGSLARPPTLGDIANFYEWSTEIKAWARVYGLSDLLEPPEEDEDADQEAVAARRRAADTRLLGALTLSVKGTTLYHKVAASTTSFEAMELIEEQYTV